MPFWHLCQKHSPATAYSKHSRTSSNSLQALHQYTAPLLKHLHWLPVSYRIQYKIALLTYKSLHSTASPYLSSLIQSYNPTRNLRSSNAHRHCLHTPVLVLEVSGWLALQFGTPCLALSKHAHLLIALKNN